MEYQGLYTPEAEGGFSVTFPDFDWGVTQGDTIEEADDMAVDALNMVIAHYMSEGKALPAPRRHRGRNYRAIRLPALLAAKAALYTAFLKSGIRKAELARRLGIPRMNVDRLFDLKHRSRLDQIEDALRALGKELDITIRDAA